MNPVDAMDVTSLTVVIEMGDSLRRSTPYACGGQILANNAKTE